MVDVDPIRARLTAITPGTWRRHGGDIYAGGDQTTPLLRGRVRTAEVRAQTDADGEYVCALSLEPLGGPGGRTAGPAPGLIGMNTIRPIWIGTNVTAKARPRPPSAGRGRRQTRLASTVPACETEPSPSAVTSAVKSRPSRCTSR
jgi:hypothetical protein